MSFELLVARLTHIIYDTTKKKFKSKKIVENEVVELKGLDRMLVRLDSI